LGIPICVVGLQQLACFLGLSAREPEDAIKRIGLVSMMFVGFGFLIGIA
jgi:hypothetical protein